MTERFKRAFIAANLFVIFAGGALLGYLRYFDGETPIVIRHEPLKMVEPTFDEEGNYQPKSVFRTGERLTYAFEYCKTRNTPAEIFGSYIDTVKIDMPSIRINSKVGCNRTISDLFKVPKILPSGKYHFEVELLYQVNPLREVRVRYRTEDFQIINQQFQVK